MEEDSLILYFKLVFIEYLLTLLININDNQLDEFINNFSWHRLKPAQHALPEIIYQENILGKGLILYSAGLKSLNSNLLSMIGLVLLFWLKRSAEKIKMQELSIAVYEVLTIIK